MGLKHRIMHMSSKVVANVVCDQTKATFSAVCQVNG